MPIWQWIKNGIPPYAEQQTIINQVEEKINDFKQLVPEGFVELKQLNWMCSTQGWKEPVCERYNCLINGEWKQVDIRHNLLERLGLEKGKVIPFPTHVSRTVQERGVDWYSAYNVEREEEIFLQKSFTVENLKVDIDGLFEKIKKLEGEKEELKRKLEKERGWWDKWIRDMNYESNGVCFFGDRDYSPGIILSDQNFPFHGFKFCLNGNQIQLIDEYKWSKKDDLRNLTAFKLIYQYYRDK